jgi:outer membrane lipoprotein carrier protein
VKKGLFSLLFLLLLSLAFVGTSSWAQEERDEVAPILEQLKKAQESLKDFTADIKQVKISSLFTEPVVSQGKMRLKRPDRIWVEMYPPYPNITVLNQGVLLYYFPEEKVAQRYDVAGNPVLAKWLLFFQNPIETLGKDIQLLEERAGEAVLSIDPAEDLAAFQEIRITIDTANWMPKKLELLEKNGDRTAINYENVRINVGIPDSSFQLRLPPDVDIIEPMKHQ